MTCLHAAVAQKSYGSEKRFLCPPPIVSINQNESHPLVSMAVVCENGDRFLEQKIPLDEENRGSFKYLHVTGTAKAKQFYLRVSLSQNNNNNNNSTTSLQQPYVTFFSNPISIISKPSKKTSKARNVSSCITSNSPVSLFNRINSQTVRTKYMTTENGQLCAKNSTWTPFDVLVVRQPATQSVDEVMSSHQQQPQHTSYNHNNSNGNNNNNNNNNSNNNNGGNVAVTYGCEIVLKDAQTGTTSPPMIIRKVDKGRIAPSACGPVSQMQKIALQLVSDGGPPVYLSASGKAIMQPTSSSSSTSATWLDFSPSKMVVDKPGQEPSERVDDYLCWTIVASTTTNQPSPPPSPPRRIMPLPMITSTEYDANTHRLDLVGQHLIQATVGRLFDFCLGSQGPLQVHIQQEETTAGTMHLSIDLPPTQDLLVANHDVLISRKDGSRYLELPLVLKRHDGTVYTTGKGLACD
ncbi:beta-trefoil DNA-binding domain-containing protein, partial [Phascolomyces articulosus]